MSVAYLVLSHSRPAQVSRLVRTLKASSPGCVVVVDHSRQGEPIDVEGLSALPGVHVTRSDGGYGDWSHLRRWYGCADLLSEQGIDYGWLVTLSGQDYPLLPLSEFERDLADSGVDGFLEHFPVLARDKSPWSVRTAVSRYWFHHKRLAQLTRRQQEVLWGLQAVNFVQPLIRVHVSFGLTFGWRVRTPYTEDLVCYGGLAWTTLNRDCVEYLREFRTARPDVVEHYRRVLAPDESFLHTALVNAHRFRLRNETRRYVDFRRSRFNHPKTLGREDLPEAFASGAPFGRKFDLERDPDVFEELDRRVLATGCGDA